MVEATMDGSGPTLINRAADFIDRTAVIDDSRRWSYGDLLDRSHRAASCLLDGRRDLNEARVAFLVGPGTDYVAAQWGIWRAGGLAVPLCTAHPALELAYVIEDSQASVVVTSSAFKSRLEPIVAERGLRLVTMSDLYDTNCGVLPSVADDRRAMLIYTSGTTSKPKGVVSTHAMIAAQVRSLVEAWDWTRSDHILHVLPLHHIHGIVNILCCAMWSGATCEFLPRFDAQAVWRRIEQSENLTLFMAVPTIYARLITAYDEAPTARQEAMREGCRRLRLMVSGSAALPVPVLEKWRAISGHTLLERYGMTEIGMALSNPLDGRRYPGCVGTPLPGVEARLIREDGSAASEGQNGEIQINGPGVFREYWNRPEATAAAFTTDGWLKTGDIAVCEAGVYRILGRNSIDIIKTGGYKISALEIESVLRTHESIADCAVVGVEDAEWGQRVAAAVILRPEQSLGLADLRGWAKERLAVYKVPSLLMTVDDLPHNVMGKVTKPQVVKLFVASSSVAES